MRAILLLSILLVPSHAGFLSKKSVLVKSVQYKECPNDNGVIVLRDAQVLSTESGDIVVSGSASTAINITAPVKASVSVSRKVLGLWVPVPCVLGVGSCTYKDVCQYGVPVGDKCPGALEENDIPCRCPIPQGRYSLPGAQFPIPTTFLAGVLAGNYKATVKFSTPHKLIACYVLRVQLQ